jgi:hypothetical protein
MKVRTALYMILVEYIIYSTIFYLENEHGRFSIKELIGFFLLIFLLREMFILIAYSVLSYIFLFLDNYQTQFFRELLFGFFMLLVFILIWWGTVQGIYTVFIEFGLVSITILLSNFTLIKSKLLKNKVL